MSFTRSDVRTLGAAASALLASSLLWATGCQKDTSKPKTEEREFPRTAAASKSDKTSVTPAASASGIEQPAIEESPAEPETVPEPAEQRPLPESYQELMAAGKRLLGSGETQDALAHFEKAIELEPERATPKIQMARTFLDMGDAGQARPFAEAAVDLAPDSSFAWNTLGRVELAENHPDAAITSFTRATDENEDNSYAWNNVGYVYLLRERWEEAAAALENATSGNAPTAYMWNNLGLAYEHLDFAVEARAAYRQAADLGSEKGAASLSRIESQIGHEPVGEVLDESLSGPADDITE